MHGEAANLRIGNEVFFFFFPFAPTAAPRLEVPENYLDGLIFRQEEVVRLKVPLVAKPNPTVRNLH